MDTPPDDLSQGPTRPPVDADEERQRLIADVSARGVDEEEALELAEQLARREPLPDAYRAVDRRLATGYSVDEARDMLLDESPTGDEEET